MPRFDDQLEAIYASDRKTWREWLERNYRTSLGVWLIYYKVKSGKPNLNA
ncbi:MAG: hypothetical protein WA919_17600 [Coleofasciculaceae cyanobacterium]